ncbi:MAG: hypothetical protein MUP64_16160 [Anaerolineae bacterium]|nr:hypothetical protein [Anaerolineae bacterium]
MPTAHQGSLAQTYEDRGRVSVFIAPPVVNQWYPVLNDTNVHISCMNITQFHTEAGVKNLEVRFTFNGVVYAAVPLAAANGTWYYPVINVTSLTPECVCDVGFVSIQRTEGIEVKDALIEVRITSALGTAQDIRASVQYQKLAWTTM